MENNKAIFFDSLKHIRKISTRFTIVSPEGTSLFEKNIVLNRLMVWKTEFYNRINFHMAEEYLMKDFEEVINELYRHKQERGYNTYLSVVCKPHGQEHDNSMVFFISGVNIPFLDKEETSNGDRVYTTVADDECYAIVNGEKVRNGNYEQLAKTENKANPEEIKFIEDSMNRMSRDDWFPTIKESLEQKKKIEKEKKKNESKASGGLFGKKKEAKEVTNTVQDNDGGFINMKSLKVHKGSLNPDFELDGIIGLENIKKDIKKMQYMLEYEKNRQTRGIESHDSASMHMCFMGHPGTGKTTIARIMTGILYSMKYIKENQCIEISGLDLMGGYVGQTAIITKQIVDKARGGILFIDEAYALCEDKGNSFGKEAVSVLLKEMEDNRSDLVVIFAGYEDDMNQFLNINPGFRSRINKYFDFVDYTTIELSQIFLNYIRKMHLKISEDALNKCVELFNEARKHPKFSNGRFVRNLVEQIEEYHILNTVEEKDYDRLDLITVDDVPQVLIDKMLYGM